VIRRLLWLLIDDADVVAQTALHLVGPLLSDKLAKSRPARLEPRPSQRVYVLRLGRPEIGIWRERCPVDLGLCGRQGRFVE
jgi:hypothetical protein